MRKTDIERIIKQGSTRQKIKLYFTDVAHFNTVGMATAEIKGTGERATVEVKDKILTDKERELIFNSIKEKKDIKYWEDLRTWNKAFLMFKPSVSTYRSNFYHLTAQLSKYTTVRLIHKGYENSINEILEEVKDKKLRETLVNTAIKSLKEFDAKKNKDFIQIPEANIDSRIALLVEIINEKTEEAKEYIEGIKAFLNKNLPLQPYKEFIKYEEDKIRACLDECMRLVEAFLAGTTIETPIDKPIKVDIKKRATEVEDERFKLINWEDIEVEITQEDLEDIKSAGI